MLHAIALAPSPGVTPNKEVKSGWKRHTEEANAAKRDKALARYRAVWEQEWESTTTIDARLGHSRCTAYQTLRDWEADGLVESRERIPGARKHGLEWRWVK